VKTARVHIPEPSDPEAELRIAEIWRSVLGVADDENGASFVDVGGRALAALRIVVRIRADLGFLVYATDLYEHPRLDSFIRHVITRRRVFPAE